MEVINNTGQPLDFNKPYIVTVNTILLFDSYSEYQLSVNHLSSIEINEGEEIFFNFETQKFEVK
jgi:hypothetical protein